MLEFENEFKREAQQLEESVTMKAELEENKMANPTPMDNNQTKMNTQTSETL